MCGLYGGGAVNQSLWPRGVEYLLAFTCIKSECSCHAQAGGGGGAQDRGFQMTGA